MDAASGGGILKSKKKECSKDKVLPEHLQWDEEVIREHDKTRGTRMKIEEPKTPYVGPSREPSRHASGELVSEPIKQEDFMAQLTVKMKELEEERSRKETFEKKRKAHYDEFIKAARMSAESLNDDDDNDNDHTGNEHHDHRKDGPPAKSGGILGGTEAATAEDQEGRPSK